jgi:flagellar biosynthesis protein FlhF
MNIKKFTAPTMTEALAKVRDELGADAIILSTRSNRKGGVFDFVGRSVVEVTAAVDDASQLKKNTETRPGERKKSHGGSYGAKFQSPERSVAYEPPPMRRTDEVRVKTLSDRAELGNMVEDIKELKRSIKVLADSALTSDMAGLPTHMANLLATMKSCGFDDKIAKRLTRQLLDELNGIELADPKIIIDRAMKLILSGIGEVIPIMFTGAKPRIVAFVGPTGTGKTTTIAKLATDFLLNLDKKVSVLTIDTKRVDAVGQLKSYCRIVNIPLHIAYSPDELPSIMPKLINSDITLVDTPGLGPLDRQQMIEMVEFLQRLVPQEVHLTISVTTSLSEMTRIFEHFGLMKPNRMLFTKLDEIENYGTMFSFALLSKKPLSYVTFGQNVPGDFSLAETESLLRKNFERKTVR